MKLTNWMIAGALGIFLLSVNSTAIMRQGNSDGHGKGHNKHDDDDEKSEHYYKHHEGEAARDWYYQNEGHLPPRARQERSIATGLEKQLVGRGSLPPGLQKRIQPCPMELERRLPPPPPDCVNVIVGGHVVLLNHKTNIVMDIFHFEVN
jgi:ABC-type Zn2+ transport system substrate-binding protein/surface adhesin